MTRDAGSGNGASDETVDGGSDTLVSPGQGDAGIGERMCR